MPMTREIPTPMMLSLTARTNAGAVTIRRIAAAGNSKSPEKNLHQQQQQQQQQQKTCRLV